MFWVWQSGDKSWQVAWFSPPRSDRRGQVPLLSGGSWECDLRAADSVEALSERQVKQLGLSGRTSLGD